ncbi:MAG: hypothetical protein MJ025_07215, partial [Victivallaceae bacterium]|nr:hypothetical protein [Victivallaceae bacterium]
MNDNKKLPTWNLQAMYEDDAAWERDFKRLRPLAEKFASFKGRLAESPDVMRQAFEASDEFGRLAGKVGVYAHHKCDEDTTVNASQVRAKRFSQLMSDRSELSAWFDPEMVAIPEETIEKFLKDRKLAFYRFSIEDILR